MVKRLLALAGIFCISAALLYFNFPPPRPAQAQFVDQGTWGGTSGGSANAQTITIANYTAHKSGVILRFNPGFTNTGPATVNISGLGAVAVQRPSSLGLVALSGGELFANEPTSVMYNGSVYVLASNVDMTPIGKTVEFRGSAAPRGTLIEDGSCVSQTTYAALFSVIGTTYGSCSAGLFALPDSRGSLFAALDNQGSNGAANRITSGGSSCVATAIGTRCGAQNATLTLAQLPTGITSTSSQTALVNAGGGLNTGVTSASGNMAAPLTAGVSTGTATSTSNNTSGNAHPTLNPVLLGIRAIKY